MKNWIEVFGLMGALNSLQMWNGFSSHQLVFGKNLNLPNIMQAELPALEGTTCTV